MVRSVWRCSTPMFAWVLAGQVQALRDIDLCIHAGERVALVGCQRLRQEHAAAHAARPAAACLPGRLQRARAAARGHAVSAAAPAAPERAAQHRARPVAAGRALAAQAGAGAGRAGAGGHGRSGAAQWPRALGRPAAAPGAGAGLGAAARGVAARRTHRQPRSARQARGRGADRGLLRRQRPQRLAGHAGVRQPQPGPGQAPGQPRDLPGAGPAAGRPAGPTIFSTTSCLEAVCPSAHLFVQGESL